MTGAYQERFGTFWYNGQGLTHSEFTTIAEHMKSQNYVNGYVGKFHYGGDHNPGNRNFPLDHGFDYFYGSGTPRKHYLIHNAAAEAEFQKIKEESGKWGQSLQKGPMWIGREKVDQDGFATELFAEKACEFMDKNMDKPFFLQLAFNAVHNFTHQLPDEYLKEHNLKGYHDWDPSKEEYMDWYRAARYPNNPEGRALYLGQLYYLDKEVGRVLDYLDKTGLRENTIVIYISDNGGSTPIYANNAPLRGSKYTLYDGGIRVPMIISWPEKYKQGLVSDNLVSAMDIYPTIAKAIGSVAPKNVNGIELNDLLTGKDESVEHQALVWDTKLEQAVRSGKWKYKAANTDEHGKFEGVEVEVGEFLYDMEADPGESVNLADKYPEKFNELKQVYKEWRAGLEYPGNLESIDNNK